MPEDLAGLDRSLGHPRLFFTLEEVAALRERGKTGWLSEIRAGLMRRADAALAAPLLIYQHSEGNNEMQVYDLALAGYLTGDRRYFDTAIRVLCGLAETSDPRSKTDFPKVLSLGTLLGTYAIGYDWLAPFMTPQQRELILKEMEDAGSYIYEIAQTEVWGQDNDLARSSNWSGVILGGLGLAALTLDNHPEWSEFCNRRVAGFLGHVCDATGAPGEGLGYINYGTRYAMPLAYALERRNEKLIPDGAGLAHLPDYLLETALPWGENMVSINQMRMAVEDARFNFSDPGIWSAMIARSQDRVGLWAWLRAMRLDRPVEERVGHEVSAMLFDKIFLFADPDLLPLSPQEAGRPLSKCFENRVVTARTGWGDDDALMTFTAGKANEGGWHHHDGNAFAFFAHGDALAIDPGLTRITGIEHNTITVDGGSYAIKNPWEIAPSSRLGFKDHGDYVEVAGDVTAAYAPPFARAVRRVYFVRAAQPYLLVLDDIQKDEAPHRYGWRMHTPLQNKVEIDPGQCAARIVGSRNQTVGTLKFLSPAKVDLSLQEMPDIRPDATNKDNAAVIVGETTAVNGGFAVLLVASRPGETPPVIEQSGGDATAMEVRVRFPDGSVDTLTVKDHALQAFTRR